MSDQSGGTGLPVIERTEPAPPKPEGGSYEGPAPNCALDVLTTHTDGTEP
ncbi:hypothetical protein TPA0910_67700 [Streptomyces hygroscopicus subsp. sporocinereus]|uniref:Uncharacterized protein n=1 Tax=Streptomyces hygroscopicus TaxID=1912 RepID=A0ABQ3UA08_STRHY|nr:hypothetical protein TPA0910_67700 [Streptomyces hygroscopicus]